jgi:hypothetical protein
MSKVQIKWQASPRQKRALLRLAKTMVEVEE